MKLTAPAAGLCLVALFLVTNNQSAQAEELPKADLVTSVLSVKVDDPLAAQPAATPPAAPTPVEHIVVDGENLSKIALVHATTWQRLYAKNTQIQNPDIITVGDKIVIPLADEVLAERALPTPPPAPPVSSAGSAQGGSQANSAPAGYQPAARGASGGNSYGPGYCTYYAKQRRPDLPNNLGHAGTWASQAATQGIPTGSAPRAGAIGQQGNHVVFVESVNGNGTVTVSEMNWNGNFGGVSSRTAPASSFQYIY